MAEEEACDGSDEGALCVKGDCERILDRESRYRILC